MTTFEFDDKPKEELQREPHLQQTNNLTGGPSEVEPALSNAEAEFLHYHYKYGHISPKRIQAMARLGVLPKRLATCQIPVCPACLYGKATKRAWRNKPSLDQAKTLKPTSPGAVVSVDMLTSPTPGLIAQMTGTPTYKRYLHAAIYVDQATGSGFVWLQKSISEEETLEGKLAFERHCRSTNVTVHHYHADNGIFASNGWKQSCASERQTLTFAGVNAHHQNGIAERRIRELQNLARTMMIHAQQR
ncbi:MAG TPA: GAG-pre-integrase domain-containing protein [Fusibacter sp.]|nr:GAG-pre-integrase domain-containing protein [Fusibacter sp.]